MNEKRKHESAKLAHLAQNYKALARCMGGTFEEKIPYATHGTPSLQEYVFEEKLSEDEEALLNNLKQQYQAIENAPSISKETEQETEQETETAKETGTKKEMETLTYVCCGACPDFDIEYKLEIPTRNERHLHGIVLHLNNLGIQLSPLLFRTQSSTPLILLSLPNTRSLPKQAGVATSENMPFTRVLDFIESVLPSMDTDTQQRMSKDESVVGAIQAMWSDVQKSCIPFSRKEWNQYCPQGTFDERVNLSSFESSGENCKICIGTNADAIRMQRNRHTKLVILTARGEVLFANANADAHMKEMDLKYSVPWSEVAKGGRSGLFDFHVLLCRALVDRKMNIRAQIALTHMLNRLELRESFHAVVECLRKMERGGVPSFVARQVQVP